MDAQLESFMHQKHPSVFHSHSFDKWFQRQENMPGFSLSKPIDLVFAKRVTNL